MPTIGDIADWASILGLALTLANAVALAWIVRRTQFNLTADNIIARVDAVRVGMSGHLSYDDRNRTDVLELANRCVAILKGIRRMTDRQSRSSIDECSVLADSLAKTARSGMTGSAVESGVNDLYAKLAGVEEDLISLRDRRRASP